MDKTCLFDVALLKQAQIEYTLKDVYKALIDKGYDPLNQLAGYLKTGDETLISNHKNARSKIKEIDRALIIAFLLEQYLKWDI